MTLTVYVDGERVDPGSLVIEDDVSGAHHMWTGHGVEGLFLAYRAGLRELRAIEETLAPYRTAAGSTADGWDTAALVGMAIRYPGVLAEREALFEEYRAGRLAIAGEDLEAFTVWSAARGEHPLAAGGSGVAGSAG